MSLHRLSGKDFDVMINDTLIHIEEATVSITDNRKVRKTKGVADGYVDGDCEAEVSWAVNHENYLLIEDIARQAGSWKSVEPFDMSFMAKVAGGEKRIEVFGILPILDELLNINPNGGETDKTKFKSPVTDKRFVRTNGVPYLRPDEIENL